MTTGNRFGLKEVCDVTFYDLSTGLPVLYLDTLKISDMENKATTTYAMGGRGNPRILGWDFDRESTFKVQDALMSLESLSVLAGNSITTGAANIFKREVLTVAMSTGATPVPQVTLTKTPIANSISVWKTTDGGKTQSIQITDITTNASDVQMTALDASAGDKVIVFYQWTSDTTAQTLSFTSDSFPAYFQIVGDTVVRDEVTGSDEGLQIVIPKAKLDATFTLTMRPDGNPSVLDFTLEVFKEAQDTEMVKFVRYED